MTKDILIWSLACFAGVAFLIGVAVGHFNEVGWRELWQRFRPYQPRRSIE